MTTKQFIIGLLLVSAVTYFGCMMLIAEAGLL